MKKKEVSQTKAVGVLILDLDEGSEGQKVVSAVEWRQKCFRLNKGPEPGLLLKCKISN